MMKYNKINAKAKKDGSEGIPNRRTGENQDNSY